MKRILCALVCLCLLAPMGLAQQVMAPPQLEDLQVLTIGTVHPDVARLKDRLFELGYYRVNVVNQRYTHDTARAIREFQEMNGLKADGIATPELQVLFYSDQALPKPRPTPRPTATPRPTPTPVPTPTPYMEPVQPLALGLEAHALLQGHRLWFAPQVINTSERRTVAGFTLRLTALDAQGQPLRLQDGSEHIMADMALELAPGALAAAQEVLLHAQARPARAAAAVAAVRFSDGTQLQVAEDDLVTAAWELEPATTRRP